MDAVRADGISALRAGNARPYEFDHTSGGERRGDHWSPALPPLWGSWRAAPERDIHKPRRAAASLPFRGDKPLRRGRADEGIGSYRVRRKIGEAGGQSRPPLQGAMQDQKNGALVSVWQKMSVTR